MARRTVAFGVVLLTVGCSDPVGEAQKRLEFAEKNGATNAELCPLYRDVEAAYLKRRDDDEGFQRAKLYADINCQAARLVPNETPEQYRNGGATPEATLNDTITR